MSLAVLSFILPIILFTSSSSFAESSREGQGAKASPVVFDDRSDEVSDPVEISEKDLLTEQESELALTQSELRSRQQTLIGLNLGPVFPWQNLGVSLNWWDEQSIWGLSLGGGDFELSDVESGRALFMDTSIKSVWLSYRRHIRNYPFFWEAYSGLEFWNAELRPRANEQVAEAEAASLISDFSGTAVSAGFKLGMIWQWQNGFFIEYAILHGRMAKLISEEYTINSSLAREMSRNQVEALRSWGGINLKIGMALN